MQGETMYRLHGFCQSGNSFKVAFALRAMHLPWEPVFVDYMHGATRDSSWRETVNEMGEAPVLEVGGKLLTQSGAILTMLAKKHGMFGGQGEDEQYDVLRWLLFDNHKFTSYFATWRFMKSFGTEPPGEEVTKFLKGRIDGNLAIVEKHLAARDWIVGSAPTIADISMCAYLLYPKEEHGYDFPATHPRIAAWLDRVRGIDGYADPYTVLPGERLMPRW
jgi:glutathione S-transferase